MKSSSSRQWTPLRLPRERERDATDERGGMRASHPLVPESARRAPVGTSIEDALQKLVDTLHALVTHAERR